MTDFVCGLVLGLFVGFLSTGLLTAIGIIIRIRKIKKPY